MSKLPTILERILDEKRREVAERKDCVPVDALKDRIGEAAPSRNLADALKRGSSDPIRLIAEFKRASPSKGEIRADLNPEDVARRYADAGAAAMSVLADAPFFSGSLGDLTAARQAIDLPILRKDFIIDTYQLFEARAAGADAVLLIVAALDRQRLAALLREAQELNLDCLVEVHDEGETDIALAVGAQIVGVNNRNLHTFEVDIEAGFRLRERVPERVVMVAESGIRTRADALRLENAGIDAMLVGECLMREPDPGKAAAALLGKGGR